MALELIHTSAPSGLHPGTSGFCTVAMTTGMPAAMEERLAALGGYRPAGDSGASPPSFSHLRLELGGRARSVLGAVREAPADHSGRRNKLAHHLVLDDADMTDSGPASLLRAQGVMIERFEGPSRWIPMPRSLPQGGAAAPRRCDAWERACGDAGWAGELVNQWHLDPSRVSCVVYPSSCDPLVLIDEALSLLPPQQRWRVTFATHFQQPIAGAPCAWRFCLEGTQAALEAPGRATGFFVDLGQARQERSKAGHGRYAELARRGGAPWWGERAASGSQESARGPEATGEFESGGSEDSASGAAPASGAMALPWSDATGAVPQVNVASSQDPRRGTAEPRGAGVGVNPATTSRTAPDRSSAAPWILAAFTLVAGTAVGVVIDRTLLARRGASATNDAKIVESEVDRLEASRRELETQLRRSEESLATTRNGLRRTEEERDHAFAARDSAVAQLRSFELMAGAARPGTPGSESSASDAPKSRERRAADSASPGTAPNGTGGSSTPAPTSPSIPARGVAPGPQPPAGDASPGDPSVATPSDEPVDSNDRVIVLPANAWGREISNLGVVSTDRRRIVKLSRIIRTLDLVEAPTDPSISVRRSANGRSLRISAQPREGPPREVLLIEAEGAELFAQWLLTGPPSRLAPFFEAVDAMLATGALVVRLDSGAIRELVTAPRRFEVQLDPKGEGVVNLGWKVPTVRLAADMIDGWSIGAGATEASLKLDHASGSLRVELDRATGTVQLRFASPLVDSMVALEKERRDLEADRPNVAPDERAFHDAREREVREALDRLKAQAAVEKLQIPRNFPEIRVLTADERRALAIIGPRAGTPAGDPR